MPVYKNHTAIVYRRENGDDIIYSRSFPLSHLIPLYVKFTYTYPPILVINNNDIVGSYEPSRLLFPAGARVIDNPYTDEFVDQVIAGYCIPFTDRDLVVPTLINSGVFATIVRFTQTKRGLKRLIPVTSQNNFYSIYMRFHLNNRLRSYVKKYYNLPTILPLFTGVLFSDTVLPKEPTLMR
jgi:hypothetical protein